MTTFNPILMKVTSEKSKRKPYNNYAGYIASRRNLLNNGWVVIYEAALQGLDIDSGRYAVVCETHNTILQTTSLPKARPLLKYPDFCESCASLDIARHRGLTEASYRGR